MFMQILEGLSLHNRALQTRIVNAGRKPSPNNPIIEYILELALINPSPTIRSALASSFWWLADRVQRTSQFGLNLHDDRIVRAEAVTAGVLGSIRLDYRQAEVARACHE